MLTDVLEFMTAMGVARDGWNNPEKKNLCVDLITEEYNELTDELIEDFPDVEKLAKEAADLLYVIFYTMAAFKIPIDVVFSEVHKSNMSKLVDGKPMKNAAGKVQKGPNYKPPDLSFLR